MRTFSTSDLSRKSGDIIASALQSPVSISQRGKPRLIMLSVEQYEMLTARDVDRRLTPPFGHEVGKALAHNRHVLISIAGMQRERIKSPLMRYEMLDIKTT